MNQTYALGPRLVLTGVHKNSYCITLETFLSRRNSLKHTPKAAVYCFFVWFWTSQRRKPFCNVWWKSCHIVTSDASVNSPNKKGRTERKVSNDIKSCIWLRWSMTRTTYVFYCTDNHWQKLLKATLDKPASLFWFRSGKRASSYCAVFDRLFDKKKKASIYKNLPNVHTVSVGLRKRHLLATSQV